MHTYAYIQIHMYTHFAHEEFRAKKHKNQVQKSFAAAAEDM